MLLDHESGIFHLTNRGVITWADLAEKVADVATLDPGPIEAVPVEELELTAIRPRFTALVSEKGIALPALDEALNRYFECIMDTFKYQCRAG